MPFACATAEAATATITTTTTATTTMSATDKPRPETIRQLFAQRIKTKTKSITGVCLRCAASLPGCPCLSPLALCTALLDVCLSLCLSFSHTRVLFLCSRLSSSLFAVLSNQHFSIESLRLNSPNLSTLIFKKYHKNVKDLFYIIFIPFDQ